MEINLIDEIFHALDGIQTDQEKTGMELLGAMLAMEEDKFKVIVPALQDSFEKTFNATEAKVAFAQMMNMQGIKLEDITNSLEAIFESVDNMDLSEQKKDFLKTIFSIFVNAMSDSEGIAKRVISIPIELCHPDAKLPTYSTDGSAAMDVYSTGDYTINPGETILIPLGIKTAIPSGYALLIHPRSGLSAKTKIRIPNTVAIIDSDYHGEICVEVENISSHIIGSETGENGEVIAPLYGSSFTISKGERFAQLRLVEVPKINWLPVDSLGDFENDHGKGFGSTGKF